MWNRSHLFCLESKINILYKEVCFVLWESMHLFYLLCYIINSLSHGQEGNIKYIFLVFSSFCAYWPRATRSVNKNKNLKKLGKYISYCPLAHAIITTYSCLYLKEYKLNPLSASQCWKCTQFSTKKTNFPISQRCFDEVEDEA